MKMNKIEKAKFALMEAMMKQCKGVIVTTQVSDKGIVEEIHLIRKMSFPLKRGKRGKKRGHAVV